MMHGQKNIKCIPALFTGVKTAGTWHSPRTPI